jgi:hypothetical protein
MALGTEEATYNAAVDTLMAAWQTMIDAGAGAEVWQIVWVESKKGDNAEDSTQGADTTATYDFGRRYFWANIVDTAGDIPLEIGGKPLFFKVTNAAGDLT